MNSFELFIMMAATVGLLVILVSLVAVGVYYLVKIDEALREDMSVVPEAPQQLHYTVKIKKDDPEAGVSNVMITED